MDPVRQARIDLAAALRWAERHGFSEAICNHFSFMVPGATDRFLINPQGWHWREIAASSLLLVGDDGKLIEGDAPPEPTAFYIHWRLHRAAPQARCILHTHMPYATALTLTGVRGLDTTLSQNAMRFHGRVALDAHYNGLALDHSEGERIARAMEGADVAFLGNHGVVVCGERMDYAYDDLYILERACMVEVIARSTGLPLVPVDAALAAEVAAQINGERLQSTLFYEALRRLVPAAR